MHVCVVLYFVIVLGGEAELEGFANASLSLCEGSEGGGPCKHIREAAHAAQVMEGRGVMLIQATLLEWVRRVDVCRACAGSAEKLIKLLASGFTRFLPLKSCIDPKKHPRMPDTWKYDEDYRKQMVEALPAKRKCSTAHAIAGEDGVTPSAQGNWELERCLEHQSACWRSFDERPGVYITQEDAARTGNPAKELVFLTIAHCSDNGCLGTVLPPQAQTNNNPRPKSCMVWMCSTLSLS